MDEPLTTPELLEQWRDASRAAELAERLANLARTSVERSDRDSLAAQEIARIAERTAKHAERTARIARDAAERAMAFASENRAAYLAEAEASVDEARREEASARDRYYDAERLGREQGASDLSRG